MMAQLTACVTLLPEPKPAPSIFRFSHPAEANRNSILPDKVVLAVDEPAASDLLDSEHLFVKNHSGSLSLIDNIRLDAPLPEALHLLIARRLRAADPNLQALSHTRGVRADFLLQSEIYALELSGDLARDAEALARFEMSIQLVDRATTKILLSRDISSELSGSAGSDAQAFALLDGAVQDVISQISSLVLTAIKTRREEKITKMDSAGQPENPAPSQGSSDDSQLTGFEFMTNESVEPVME